MQKNTHKIDFANTLRGFAALSVVISHYFGVFWLSREAAASLTNTIELPLATHGNPIYVLWLNKFALLNWGAYGVALFFIISGFVIPFSLQKGSSLSFAVNRLFRIIPTYVVGFTITLLALFTATKYFHTPWPYSLKEILIHYIPGIRDVLWSKSIDGIVWTLEIEMKFYLIGALAIAWYRRYSLKVFLIPLFLFLGACYLTYKLPELESKSITCLTLALTFILSSQYLIFMFVGVMFHYLYCQKIEVNKGYLGIAGLFVLYCLHWWQGPYNTNLNLAWSYGFALVTFMFAYSFPHFFKANPVFNFLANISYPWYVIHGFSGYILLRIMLHQGFRASVSLTITVLISVTTAWLLHRLVELPSQAVGKKLSMSLNDLALASKARSLFDVLKKQVRI